MKIESEWPTAKQDLLDLINERVKGNRHWRPEGFDVRGPGIVCRIESAPGRVAPCDPVSFGPSSQHALARLPCAAGTDRDAHARASPLRQTLSRGAGLHVARIDEGWPRAEGALRQPIGSIYQRAGRCMRPHFLVSVPPSPCPLDRAAWAVGSRPSVCLVDAHPRIFPSKSEGTSQVRPRGLRARSASCRGYCPVPVQQLLLLLLWAEPTLPPPNRVTKSTSSGSLARRRHAPTMFRRE